MTTLEILTKAKEAKQSMMLASTEQKNNALYKMAEELVNATEEILAENQKDVEAARGIISEVMIDRLLLTETRILQMAQGIREVAELPDPVGKVLNRVERENGLVIEKTAVAMGVIAIIYESRPNVTSDAAALALKSGNVCVLRGGKEAYHSAAAIVKALKRGLVQAGISEDAVNLIEDTTRASVIKL